jgi:hypothetical protein
MYSGEPKLVSVCIFGLKNFKPQAKKCCPETCIGVVPTLPTNIIHQHCVLLRYFDGFGCVTMCVQ